jgi:hypothetical protein
MKKNTFLFLVLFFVSCNKENDTLDGKTFVGVEEKSGCSDLILVQNSFTFYGDSVLLKSKYIKHFSKELLKQSYQYKGKVEKKQSEIDITVFAYKCPDCNTWDHLNGKTGKLEKLPDQKTFKGFFKDGELVLNNFTYKQ